MRILLAFSCVFYVTTLTSAMNTVYMDQRCGQSKYIGGNATVRIKLTASGFYRPGMNCTFSVNGGYIGEDRLMIQFRNLDTEATCSNDWLTLYDGSTKSSSTIGRNKFCGYNTPSTIYTTSGSDLTFYFHSDSSVQLSGFEIILTHFKTGFCDSWETDCNNGRCIDDSLACNGYNPCGDLSDCDDSGSAKTNFAGATTAYSYFGTGGIAGVVVGSIVFVFFCVIIIVAVRRSRLYPARRAGVTVATVSTTAMPPPQPQGYGQPVPQQFAVPTHPGMYPGQNMTSYPHPAYTTTANYTQAY